MWWIDFSLSNLHLFYYYLCYAETTFVQLFWLILNLTSGRYQGRILGRFGVRPANVGQGRVLGLWPGWPYLCRTYCLAAPDVSSLFLYQTHLHKKKCRDVWHYFLLIVTIDHLFSACVVLWRRNDIRSFQAPSKARNKPHVDRANMPLCSDLNK